MVIPARIAVAEPPPWMPEEVAAAAFNGSPRLIRIDWSAPERRVMRCRKTMSPAEWAEKHRVVTYGPLKGSRWDHDFMPHMRGILDAAAHPAVKIITNCKAPQTGSSAGMETFLAWAADQDPGPALIVYPDRDTASKRSQDYLQDVFRLSPRLRDLLTGLDDDMARLRLKLTTMLIYMGWAGSVTSIGNVSVRYLFLDEVDKYPDTPNAKEASTMDLVLERVRSFKFRAKVFIISTPTIETGPVRQAFQNADVRFDYHASCPACGRYVRLEWDQIRWPYLDDGADGPEEARVDPKAVLKGKMARYVCQECGSLWDDRARDKAVRGGEWFARDDGRPLMRYLDEEAPEQIAFHSPAWISPLVSLSECAAAYLRGRRDPQASKYFATQIKAEPWKEVVIETTEDQVLEARCDLAPQTVPEEAIALTCGVDMQRDGFWFAVRAWARTYVSWLIHYGKVQTWGDLEDLLFGAEYPMADGRRMRIFRAGLDTGGTGGDGKVSMTEEAYFWLRRNGRGRGCRVWGTKGASRPLAGKVSLGKPLDKAPSGKPIRGGLQIVSLNTEALKDALRYRLEVAATTGGDMAAFLHRETGLDYVAHILAEEKRRDKNGREKWVQVRRDNHLLDCEVIAHALADPEWPGGGIHLLRGPANVVAENGGPVAAGRPRRRVRSAGVRI